MVLHAYVTLKALGPPPRILRTARGCAPGFKKGSKPGLIQGTRWAPRCTLPRTGAAAGGQGAACRGEPERGVGGGG